MTEIFTAKTVEEAKALAARHFGASQDAITFEILEEPKKGFFRMKGDARVRATYLSVDVTDHSAAESTVTEAAPIIEETIVQPMDTPEEIISEEVSEVVEQEIVEEEEPLLAEKEETFAETVAETLHEPAVIDITLTEEPEATAEEVPAEEAAEAPVEAAVQEKPMTDEELISGTPSEEALQKVEKAKTYLLSILEKMGVHAEIEVTAGAESAMLDIVAENNGVVIGKRGETLDALQYLTFMIANRGDKEYYRIILNSANYRERRRKTLEELAAKVARNVLKSGRQTTLEPMNPYERRIIHATIADIEGVVSKSIGEEPYRKVVISSLKPRRNNRRHDRGDRSQEKRGSHNRRRENRDAEVTPTRTSMDFMKTSFEKEYKKAKPEDDIHAGLYGKIEF